MKNINNFIIEKLRIGKSIQVDKMEMYTQHLYEFVSKYDLDFVESSSTNRLSVEHRIYSFNDKILKPIQNKIINKSEDELIDYVDQVLTPVFTNIIKPYKFDVLKYETPTNNMVVMITIYSNDSPVTSELASVYIHMQAKRIGFNWRKNEDKYKLEDKLALILDYIIENNEG